MSRSINIPNLKRFTPLSNSLKESIPRASIQLNGVLRPLKLGKTVAVTARYANVKAYPVSSYTQLMPDNPRWPMLEKRWQTRTDPLWWSATSSKDFAMKSTVRSWACRRVRTALVNSLKKKGWDRNGRPIAGSGQDAPLYGTLQLSPAFGSIGIGVKELSKETDMIVSEIVKKQESIPSRDAPARPAAKNQKSSPPLPSNRRSKLPSG